MAKKDVKKKVEVKEVVEEVIEPAEEEPVIETVEVDEAPEDVPSSDEVKTAKAGKRSSKSLKEVEEKQAKEERKQQAPEAAAKPKVDVKPPRSRLERRSKGYRKLASQIDNSKRYPVIEAAKLAKVTSHVKFDATVELHINLNVDPKQSDQNVRDTLVLPAGSGKTVSIAVITDDPTAAKKAGADVAGADDLIAKIEKGDFKFDVLIATPSQMPSLGKLARILGPRGLMPNPKSGTVTNDIEKAVSDAKSGKVEYRVDSAGIVHLAVGKVSFSENQLKDNIDAVLASVRSNKPSSVKNAYIKAIHLSTSMGPSIKVEVEGSV